MIFHQNELPFIFAKLVFKEVNQNMKMFSRK